MEGRLALYWLRPDSLAEHDLYAWLDLEESNRWKLAVKRTKNTTALTTALNLTEIRELFRITRVVEMATLRFADSDEWPAVFRDVAETCGLEIGKFKTEDHFYLEIKGGENVLEQFADALEDWLQVKETKETIESVSSSDG